MSQANSKLNNLACDIISTDRQLVNSAHEQALFNPFFIEEPHFCFNSDFNFINCFKRKSDFVENPKIFLDLTLKPLNSEKTFFMSHEDAQKAKAFNPIRSRSSNEIENLDEPERGYRHNTQADRDKNYIQKRCSRETGGTAPSRNSQGDREDKIIGPNFEPPDPEMWRLYNNSFPQPQIPGSWHNPPPTGPATSFKPFATTEVGQSNFFRSE